MWLLVGGAGYIGSHIAHQFVKLGRNVVVVDNLESGKVESLPKEAIFRLGSANDAEFIYSVCMEFQVIGVVFLAARKQARESINKPLEYWSDNIGALIGTLKGIPETNVKHFLLSSSCSVYGSSGEVKNTTQLNPVSPYGRTKVVSEMIVRDCCAELDIGWTALRYFNVIGNDCFPYSRDRSQECLVPAVSRKILNGESPILFGRNFDTEDGTSLRDYIDVRDLARAHVMVCDDLMRTGESLVIDKCLNVSTGNPISTLEVLENILSCLDSDLDLLDLGRREGDPERVWAKPHQELLDIGWEPKYSIRESILSFCKDLSISSDSQN
jgi:UDP-glucose 4-epimerase